jgi:hypothetical protein
MNSAIYTTCSYLKEIGKNYIYFNKNININFQTDKYHTKPMHME